MELFDSNEVVDELLEQIDEKEFLENNSDKYKPLAWVETITEVHPIEDADFLEMGKVSCGNQVVLEKGRYRAGDECVYVSVDNTLPPDPRWAFLENKKWKVRCAKFRGVWSDGLVLPLNVLNSQFAYGDDVTSDIGAKKIPEKIVGLSSKGSILGKPKGLFPSHTPKTDESNLYGMKPDRLLEKYRGKMFRASVKIHGSSMTAFYKDGYFGVCSRNLEVKDDDSSDFWKIAKAYNLQDKLERYNRNLSIQGEACGGKLNGNIYKFPELRFYVHNIYDIDSKQHLGQDEMIKVATELGLEVCPEPFPPFELNHTLEELVAMAEKPSIFNSDVPEEGLVFRPIEEIWDDINRCRLSFKIVSRVFKAKYK